MTRIAGRLRERFWPCADMRTVALDRHCVPLDGVRGLAVLLVLCYDCLKLLPARDPLTMVVRKGAAAGWIGVDLFFVLSGFLITGILLDTRGKVGYWKSFLLRRAVRIFPLYYATLVAVFLLIPVVGYVTGLGRSLLPVLDAVRENQLWYWLYGQNWLLAWQGYWPHERVLSHFWSLAVEEQFYLVWPLVVALLSRRSLGWFCATLSVGALALRVCLWSQGFPAIVPFVMTITRLDSLCCGALLAIGLRNAVFREKWAPRLPLIAVVGLTSLVCIDEVWPILKSQSLAAGTFGHSIIALAFAGLIGAAAVVPQRHVIARLFSLSGLTTLGKYSYAIYVFHRFVYAGVTSIDWTFLAPAMRAPAIFGATLFAALGLARVSWILLERPFLSLKDRFPRPGEGDATVVKPSRSFETEPAEKAELHQKSLVGAGFSEKG